VTHAAVKRAFVELRERVSYLKRLAFYTITEEQAKQGTHFHLSGSEPEEIDCVFEVDDIDVENVRHALDCYVTYQETIEKTGIKRRISLQARFESFQEEHNPPLADLSEGLS